MEINDGEEERERGRYLLSHSTEGELGIPLALLCDYQEKKRGGPNIGNTGAQ